VLGRLIHPPDAEVAPPLRFLQIGLFITLFRGGPYEKISEHRSH